MPKNKIKILTEMLEEVELVFNRPVSLCDVFNNTNMCNNTFCSDCPVDVDNISLLVEELKERE